MIVVAPDRDALATVAPALVDLVDHGTIRVLDLVVVTRERDGSVTVAEADTVDGLAGVFGLGATLGSMLSEHDLELAALALRPGTAGIVVVTEDRWAQPLSAAAKRAGGHIVAGDRIPTSRVEAVLAQRPDDDRSGG